MERQQYGFDDYDYYDDDYYDEPSAKKNTMVFIDAKKVLNENKSIDIFVIVSRDGGAQTALAAIFFPDVATVGEIPKTLFLEKRLSFALLDWSNIESYVGPAFTIAVLGMIESLLCGASASAMTRGRFDAECT